MKGQTNFNKKIIALFDNLQEQVDTLAGEIAEMKNNIYFDKFEKAQEKYGKAVERHCFEEYDKKLDKILEDKEWDSYFEERIDQTEKDTEIILNCLRYCRHRLQKHHSSGIHKADVKLKDIKRLIKELE